MAKAQVMVAKAMTTAVLLMPTSDLQLFLTPLLECQAAVYSLHTHPFTEHGHERTLRVSSIWRDSMGAHACTILLTLTAFYDFVGRPVRTNTASQCDDYKRLSNM